MDQLLDLLARWVCNVNETCVACCYHQNKIYWASNQKKLSDGKDNWQNLLEFIQDPSGANYQRLFAITANNILLLVKKGDFLKIKSEEEIKSYLLALSNAKDSHFSLANWQLVQKKAGEIFSMRESKLSQNNYLKILTPWQDLALLLRSFSDQQLTELGQKESVYLESESESEVFLLNQRKRKKTHAEIKIFNHLYQFVNQKTYLGSSKVACSHCEAIFQVFATTNKHWRKKGAHNAPELLCKNPRLVTSSNQEKTIQELAKKLARTVTENASFINQSTSERFTELLNPLDFVPTELFSVEFFENGSAGCY